MIGTQELLDILTQKGIKNGQVADVLGVSPSRVTEMYGDTRALKLDEAKRIVEHFKLEEAAQEGVKISRPVARLLVRHLAARLDQALAETDPRVDDLAQDFEVFLRYASDPRVRGKIEAAEGFFLALEAVREAPGRPLTNGR